MNRLAAATLITLVLAGLFTWQISRERRMATCLDLGGHWNGPQSRCDPPPTRPLLRRGIERS